MPSTTSMVYGSTALSGIKSASTPMAPAGGKYRPTHSTRIIIKTLMTSAATAGGKPHFITRVNLIAAPASAQRPTSKTTFDLFFSAGCPTLLNSVNATRSGGAMKNFPSNLKHIHARMATHTVRKANAPQSAFTGAGSGLNVFFPIIDTLSSRILIATTSTVKSSVATRYTGLLVCSSTGNTMAEIIGASEVWDSMSTIWPMAKASATCIQSGSGINITMHIPIVAQISMQMIMRT